MGINKGKLLMIRLLTLATVTCPHEENCLLAITILGKSDHQGKCQRILSDTIWITDLTTAISQTQITTWISLKIDSGLESQECPSKMKLMRLTTLRSKLVEIEIRILCRQTPVLWLACSINHVLNTERVNTLIMLQSQIWETIPISHNLKRLGDTWFTLIISSHIGIYIKILGKLELSHIWIDKKVKKERIIEIREMKHSTEVVMEDIRSKIVKFSSRVLRTIGTTKKMKTVRIIGVKTKDSLRQIDVKVHMIIQGITNIACPSSSLG